MEKFIEKWAYIAHLYPWIYWVSYLGMIGLMIAMQIALATSMFLTVKALKAHVP